MSYTNFVNKKDYSLKSYLPSEWFLTEEEYETRAGSKYRVSLKQVRYDYFQGNIGKNELSEYFEKWVNEDLFLILYAQDTKTNKLSLKALKCSKRGNDIYTRRISQRFNELDRFANTLRSDRIFSINDDKPQTNVLFVTLTYDTKLCSESQAWNNIGKEFNLFLSNLRKQYGKISHIRAFESYENGYPHIHCVMIFEDSKFNVFEKFVSDARTKFRIQEKKEFEKYWHSYLDIQAVSSPIDAVKYLTKYLRKYHDYQSRSNITQVMNWVYNKRSFSMSKDILKALRLVCPILHNSNQKRHSQITLDGIMPSLKWYVLGVYSKSEFRHIIKDRGKEHDWTIELEPNRNWIQDQIDKKYSNKEFEIG